MVWFQITLCLSNLMLTGSATPFLHNGILPCLYTEESNFDFGEGKVGVKRPCSVCAGWVCLQVGITGRNDIGFLLWDRDEKMTEEAGLGSRLKTPVLPIWITCVNGSWGVLFNPNKDLMKSYAAENRSHSGDTKPSL